MIRKRRSAVLHLALVGGPQHPGGDRGVAELKRQRGRELRRPGGGGGRAQTLIEHDLIDE
jgi:hypothetical protein